jgi:photosystem II stability/assembly factor-like uncharacterized protein
MFDRQTGFAIDSTGRPLFTTDGADSWQPSGVTVVPHSASVVTVVPGTHTAYVADEGALLQTADGGRTYRRLALPSAISEVDGLSFPDAHHGWIMANVHGFLGSETLDLFGTTDGGLTWTRLASAETPTGTPGPLPFAGDKFGIAFRDDHTGWLACTCGLLRTDDGGRTWQGQALPLLPMVAEARGLEFFPAQFFGPGNGLFVLLRETLQGDLLVYRTHDGGSTWQRGAVLPFAQVATSPTTYGGFVWGFADAAHGWVIEQGQFSSTADGGASWQTVVPNASLLDVWQLDVLTPAVGWAVQHDVSLTSGQLLRTLDGGRTWTPLVIHVVTGAHAAPVAVPLRAGVIVTTPSVSQQTIAGRWVSATLATTSSITGTASVLATSVGASTEFVLTAPLGGTVTISQATVQGASVGALTRVEVTGTNGERLALCFTTVGQVGAIPIPAACQRPGATVSLGVAVPTRGMVGPAAVATAEAQNGLPATLPAAGDGGAARWQVKQPRRIASHLGLTS